MARLRQTECRTAPVLAPDRYGRPEGKGCCRNPPSSARGIRPKSSTYPHSLGGWLAWAVAGLSASLRQTRCVACSVEEFVCLPTSNNHWCKRENSVKFCVS